MATVTITYQGRKYMITGNYYAGCRGSQPKPPSFVIKTISGADGVRINADVFSHDEAGWLEIEVLCIRKHQEDLAWAELHAQDRKFQEMKEAAL